MIPLELLCDRLAYETLGEIASSIYFIGVITQNIVCILIAYRYRAIAALCVVGLSLIIIPYQIMLGNRLLRVQAEVTRLVTYVYEQKIQYDEFPSDLTDYTFVDKEMEIYVQDYQLDKMHDQFKVLYRIGTEATSHWYSSGTGWGYYPD